MLKIFLILFPKLGIGEHGIPGTLPPNHSKAKYANLYSSNGYNALISDFFINSKNIFSQKLPF